MRQRLTKFGEGFEGEGLYEEEMGFLSRKDYISFAAALEVITAQRAKITPRGLSITKDIPLTTSPNLPLFRSF